MEAEANQKGIVIKLIFVLLLFMIKMAKKFKEEWKTYQNVFDNFTHRNLFKLAAKGFFEELSSTITLGKEANIFSAITKDETHVIVKIYRLQNCDFNKMYDYLQIDPRFQNLTKQRRKVIFGWTQREYQNLVKAREAGVEVPTPLYFMNNILVMQLIGKKDQVAPMLKDALPDDCQDFFERTLRAYKKLYQQGLVHGDLSEFNILNHQNRPVLIDFSQATQLRNPNAESYLKRDIRNIQRFFSKHCFECDEEDIYKRITGK